MKAGRVAVAAAGTAMLAGAGGWSVTLARADYLSGKGGVEAAGRALALAPGNAVFAVRLAAERDAAGDAAGALEAWREAVRVNPRSAKAWIGLAMQVELDGKTEEAERCLLAAREADRQYLPAWSLANFYFRHSRWNEFWRWARKAAEMAQGQDAAPLFRLMWESGAPPGEILKRGVPDEPGVLRRYLAHLLSSNLAGVEEAAARVTRFAEAGDRQTLLAACDALLVRGDPGAARRLWDRFVARGLVPYAGTRGVTNPDFALPPLSSGFDWRLNPPPGISFSLEGAAPRWLRLTFFGNQPERCEVLSQYIAAGAPGPFLCRYRYRTAGTIPAGALQWKVTDMAGRDLTTAPGPILGTGGEGEEGEAGFRVPVGCEAMRLVLMQERIAGTVRFQGTVWITGVRVEAAP